MLIQFIILQVLVFGLIIFFIKRILSKDTMTAETRLNQVYEELLEKQKQVTQKIEEAEKEYVAKKEEATALVAKMKKEAQAELSTKEDTVIKEAKAQADEMVQKARASAEDLRKRLQKEESAKVIEYCSSLIQQALTPTTIAAIHRQMVQEFISRGDSLDFSTVSTDVMEVNIKTASALLPEEKEAIDKLINSKLNREIKSQEVEDTKLIAGVALEFGTLILDGCLASAINDAALAQKKTMQEQD